MNTTEVIINQAQSSNPALLSRLGVDWFGEEVSPPVCFHFAFEGDRLVFRCCRQADAFCDSNASEGRFVEGLWSHDVAEFFISDPVTGHYLEVNLSPSGAHWACMFSAPRRRIAEVRDSGARSRGTCGPGHWEASFDVPLEWMRRHLHFGRRTRMNVTFILDSPLQRFLSMADLGGGEPDFHRPACYINWREGAPNL